MSGNRGPGSDAFTYELGALRSRREKLERNIQIFEDQIARERKMIRDCDVMIKTLEEKAKKKGAPTEDPSLFA